ncbi:DNA-binding transcriptional regulator, MurR/RpiR family, contains HTH and SIS domains [Facklamia miroungae]|uniref:DNA-binding transcriptional regulator, MurR/RpiR family, contains HTH and SIS domains n=1 Tax=Facklamia miroungae TaxID=120956 RepID=A0A1G7V378_9LACT|nr:DNA-binding transcriptional regulator, MurR/RpiR family, contains HTH and SIS domains [Facklamia miroungae]
MQNTHTVVHGTMTDIKSSTEVGDATIIRFCQKLGLTGFTDLKILAAKDDFSRQYIFEDESDYFSLLLNRHIMCLKKTLLTLDKTKIDDAIKMIKMAGHIYLYGVGSSGTTARDFEGILLRVGVKANAVIDPHVQAHIASILGSDDLIIAFSLSGKTRDIYDAISIAKKSEVQIIVITNFTHTPIAQLADIVLQTAIEEFIDGGSVAGKLSQLYICDVLVHAYESQNNVSSFEIREKVLRSILNKRID